MSSVVANAKQQSAHGPNVGVGHCLSAVVDCYSGSRVPHGTPSAIAAWQNARHKHPETNPSRIPRGVPVFWSGGSHNYGHVAIATGWFGRCYSTDILRPGLFDRVDITAIHDRWGLTLLGWSSDLNGVDIPVGRVWKT